MNKKEEYKNSLRSRYPDEPDNVLELAWHFHSVEKAKKYISQLETCNRNADLATKVVRAMYVACEIDSVQAVSEKFITSLLPFTCMEKSANPHSVTYHIRKMLNDDTVKAERRATEERIRQVNSTRLPVATSSRTVNVTIQMTFPINDEESLRKIMQFVSQQCSTTLVKVEEKSECTVQDSPVTITHLRSIYYNNEPRLTHISLYNSGRMPANSFIRPDMRLTCRNKKSVPIYLR